MHAGNEVPSPVCSTVRSSEGKDGCCMDVCGGAVDVSLARSRIMENEKRRFRHRDGQNSGLLPQNRSQKAGRLFHS